MKVALINPSVPAALKKENLGLAYIAASLQADGHKTRILDEIAGQDVDQGLDAFGPDIVGISFMTMFAGHVYELADRIRATRGLTVVFGGPHAAALPEEALLHGDCVIRGEAERAFPALLTRGRVEGVIDADSPEALDALPMPDRAQLDLEFYAAAREGFAGFSYRNLGLITSRGCPFRCDFCINSKRPSPLRLHSTERVIEEISYLVERHHIESVAFFDEFAAARPERFRAICERMIEEGFDSLRWECQMHSLRVDSDLLKLMKRAGCVQVGIGFESGSQRVLDLMRKNSTVEGNLEAAKRVQEAGLRVRGCFIIGTPGETRDDVEQTQRFIEAAKIDFASINYLTPFPGSTLFDRYAGQIAAAGVPWEHFTTGDPQTFTCNNAMAPDEQRRLFAKIRARHTFRNYSWQEMGRLALKNPRYALHIASRFFR